MQLLAHHQKVNSLEAKESHQKKSVVENHRSKLLSGSDLFFFLNHMHIGKVVEESRAGQKFFFKIIIGGKSSEIRIFHGYKNSRYVLLKNERLLI